MARCSVPRGLDSTTALEFLVLDLLVAFERHAVEHRRFVEMHDQPFAGALDRDIVEQAGCHQRLQRRIARGFIEAAVGRGVKIGTHRLGVDPAVALDLDGLGRDGSAPKNSPSAATSKRTRCEPRRHSPARRPFHPSSSLPVSH